MKATSLNDKTIVITGASSGVGRAAAFEFAKHCATLVLAGRNETALHEVAEECKKLGSEAFIVLTDVTDPQAMLNLAQKARDWQGKIDVWINNAGVLAAGDFDTTPMEVHTRVITTNLLGYMHGVHAVLPIFKEQQYGIIINNISIGGFLPVPYGAGYTASKFGLRGFSESLKGELAAWPNIHVCDLFPAFLDTPGILHAGNYTGKLLKPGPPLSDPIRVAQAMVGIVRHPTSDKYVGGGSLLLKSAHALFPELTTRLTGKIMRKYFKKADDRPVASGNLFNTVNYDMNIHGGFIQPKRPHTRRKYIIAALLAGVGVGLYLSRPKR
jgi:short-subunit dehydrogenase